MIMTKFDFEKFDSPYLNNYDINENKKYNSTVFRLLLNYSDKIDLYIRIYNNFSNGLSYNISILNIALFLLKTFCPKPLSVLNNYPTTPECTVAYPLDFASLIICYRVYNDLT